MLKEMATQRPVVRFWQGTRKVAGGAKPYTKINVKPYAIIMLEGKILCGGELRLPLVFDTMELAKLFTTAHGFKDCRFRRMELEELARKCRNPMVNFDSFYLIDDRSQLGID